MKDLNRLDKAFSPTPPEIDRAVEAAFERGAKEMKKRHKWTLALSVAAGIAVLVAAALAIAPALKTVPDNAVAAPLPLATVSIDINSTVQEEAVYFTEQGHYYHLDEHCSGMQGAKAGTVDEATDLGKFPCPVCMADVVYCTDQGNYYHSDAHCFGMLNAAAHPIDEAVAMGKSPCPVCVAGTAERMSDVNAAR